VSALINPLMDERDGDSLASAAPREPMRLTLCIASRGRPLDLIRTITETDKRIAHPHETTISVALDKDDESLPADLPVTRSHLVWSVAAREDSLGAKYNRCAENAKADAYVLGADDNIFITQGWDDLIRYRMVEFSNQFGFVYFGRLDGTLPTQMAIPSQLVEAQGGLFPTYWPFWFHDTWTDEIAHKTGRILWADIAVEEINDRGKSRGLRDVKFWAELFEVTRPQREALGEALSRQFNPGWMNTQLLQRSDILRAFFSNRTIRLRDPATAGHFERRMSFDAPADERYLRIKANAESMLAEMNRPGKAA
jgi:hypothetical protein